MRILCVRRHAVKSLFISMAIGMVGMLGSAAAQGMAQQCDNSVLNGVYNTNCVGFIEEFQARFNSVATNTFYGDGTWEGVDVEKIEGVPAIIRTSFCGTYEVADNCELHIKFLNVMNLPDVATCDNIPPDQAPLATFDGGVSGLQDGGPAEGSTIINTGFIGADGTPSIGNTSCTSRLVRGEPNGGGGGPTGPDCNGDGVVNGLDILGIGCE